MPTNIPLSRYDQPDTGCGLVLVLAGSFAACALIAIIAAVIAHL